LLLAWDSRLGLDFFDSGLHTCTAVARLTLALAKLSCTTKTFENSLRFTLPKTKRSLVWSKDGIER